MLLVGHRGCRGLMPENTIESFEKAIRLGVDAIELDVVVSGDKKIVVSHEPFMSQTYCLKPNGSEITQNEDKMFNLYEMKYNEIQLFDCGIKAHPRFLGQKSQKSQKPLFLKAIQSCENFILKNSFKPITYIVEIKSNPSDYNIYHPAPKEYVKILLDELACFEINDRFILKSFDVAILNEINKQNSNIKTSLLVNTDESIPEKLLKLNYIPEILGPYYELLTHDLVVEYKNEGFKFYVWTVNDKLSFNKMKSFGVDAVITDYPNKFIS